MATLLELTSECLFCGRLRDWHSELWLITTKSDSIFKVTICEGCRKDPKMRLSSLYHKIPEKVREAGNVHAELI